MIQKHINYVLIIIHLTQSITSSLSPTAAADIDIDTSPAQNSSSLPTTHASIACLVRPWIWAGF